ncbi:MAG: hypothetical protein HQ567_07085 [Candidatus Nealsonbacteria bacterium]|nr:hypothetical protein [Candidatus Nealsonbacteria bacterium]
MRSPCLASKSVVRSFILAAIVATAPSSSAIAAGEIKPPTDAQAKEYELDASFYKKCTMVQGILIATSDRVSDHTHREAAYQFDAIMKRIDPQVAQRVRDRKVLCILIGHSELTSEIPQFTTDKTGKELDFYNWRRRGFLSWPKGRPTVVFAEEDVLEYEGGMQIESILIHEFAHVIHGAGFDEKLQNRLTETYRQAKEKGLWNDGLAAQRFRRVKSEEPVGLLDALVASFPDQPPELIRKYLDGGNVLVNGKPANSKFKVTKEDKVLIVFGGEKECYAGKNRSEYWAEGVQNWYDTNRTMDHDHNHIHTREQLEAYDPGLAALCKDVLGDSPWRFVSPRQRGGKEHLKGFDPATAPEVVDPDHIKAAANDYYDTYWKDYWQRLGEKHAPAPSDSAGPEVGFTTTPSSDKDYEVVDVKGWAFHIHKDYLHGDPGVLRGALHNAEIQLGHVETLVPEKAVEKLRKIPVWVTPGRRTAEYHWARKWLIDNGRNPDMAHCVQITDIGILESTRPTGPWVLLHELIHGYHDREVGKEDNQAVVEAYNAALKKGLYQKVLHSKRGRDTHVKAYAATRMEEYFAETCEAYFGVNDFYPFVRAELREYDPAIYEIIERVYHVNEKE